MPGILQARLPENAAEDRFSFLPALLGEPGKAGRESVVHHSIGGYFAIREGRWKLALCPGSGGWSDPRPGQEAEGAAKVQLFDLSADLGEKNNVEAQHAEIVSRLTQKLEALVAEGRSTPGARQSNAVPVELCKKANPRTGKTGKKKANRDSRGQKTEK